MTHINRFVDHLACRCCLPFMDEVATTKLFSGQSHCLCHFIHLTLEREDALRSAKSSKSTVRWDVCRYCLAANTYVRTAIRTCRMDRSPRKNYGRQRAVGAAIDREINLHCKELAFFRDRRFVARVRGMAFGCSHHVFGAVVHDLDWFA